MVQLRYQQVRLLLLTTLALIVSTAACSHQYTKTNLPAGAINSNDAQFYDDVATLRGFVAGATQNQDVPAQAKPYVNKAVTSANAAYDAWKAYHSAGANDSTALTAALVQLAGDISSLISAAPGVPYDAKTQAAIVKYQQKGAH